MRTAIVLIGHDRGAITPDGHETPTIGAWERDVARVALATKRPQRGLYGAVVWPFEDPDEGSGVLILPREG